MSTLKTTADLPVPESEAENLLVKRRQLLHQLLLLLRRCLLANSAIIAAVLLLVGAGIVGAMQWVSDAKSQALIMSAIVSFGVALWWRNRLSGHVVELRGELNKLGETPL